MKDVTAAIILNNKRVLITRRAPDQPHPLRWEFPGGKVEKDETYEECLIRELKEELGVSATIVKFFLRSQHIYSEGEICLMSFLVDISNQSIRLAVHDRYEWAPVAELLNYDLLPADIPIAEKLKEIII